MLYNLYVTDQPHNPMINAGAIVVASLIRNSTSIADRYDYVSTHDLCITYVQCSTYVKEPTVGTVASFQQSIRGKTSIRRRP